MTCVHAQKANQLTPLMVSPGSRCPIVNRNQLIKMQQEDISHQKYQQQKDMQIEGEKEVLFQKRGGVHCWVFLQLRANLVTPL